MRKLLDNRLFQMIYGIFKTIVTSLLVIYLVFVVVQRLTNNSSILGYRVFTVATGSTKQKNGGNELPYRLLKRLLRLEPIFTPLSKLKPSSM